MEARLQSPMPNSVTLVQPSSAESLSITAEMLANGDLQISGQDLSPRVAQTFGGDVDEYEYWITIGANDKDRVLLALLAAFYDGKPDGDERLKALLSAHNIEHRFQNYF